MRIFVFLLSERLKGVYILIRVRDDFLLFLVYARLLDVTKILFAAIALTAVTMTFAALTVVLLDAAVHLECI